MIIDMVLHRRLAEVDSPAAGDPINDLVLDQPVTGSAWTPPAGLEGLA